MKRKIDFLFASVNYVTRKKNSKLNFNPEQTKVGSKNRALTYEMLQLSKYITYNSVAVVT